jgi:hypothetical protein
MNPGLRFPSGISGSWNFASVFTGDKEAGKLASDGTLTIEKWKAEQQLSVETGEPIAAVPVNSVRPVLSGRGRTKASANSQVQVTNKTAAWPGSQLNITC